MTKVGTTTGRIGDGTYEANSIGLVGGETPVLSQITMWYNVKVSQNLLFYSFTSYSQKNYATGYSPYNSGYSFLGESGQTRTKHEKDI